MTDKRCPFRSESDYCHEHRCGLWNFMEGECALLSLGKGVMFFVERVEREGKA